MSLIHRKPTAHALPGESFWVPRVRCAQPLTPDEEAAIEHYLQRHEVSRPGPRQDLLPAASAKVLACGRRGRERARRSIRRRRPSQLRYALALLGWWGLAPAAQAAIESYAIVQDDGTLQVEGERIRLFGTFLPPSSTVCGTKVRPVDCGARAAVALRQKIQSFVRCEPKVRYQDGSLGAICTVAGASATAPRVDLGAWLIQRGLALAGPEAPFDYAALEDIARARGLGVWGLRVDRLR